MTAIKVSQPYSQFASIYDYAMKEVQFQKWANFIYKSAKDELKTINSVLDLGCGTGQVLHFLPDSIPNKTGLDSSMPMLKFAEKNFPDFHYILGNIQNFKTDPFNLIFCTHDTINYLLEKEALHSHFKSVYNSLSEDGVYFFDITSEYNLIHHIHNQTFVDKQDNVLLHWKNIYDDKEKIVISTLDFKIFTGTNLNFKNFQEVHLQKYYTIEEISEILEKEKFKIVKIGCDYNSWNVSPICSLIHFLVKRNN